ncbi:MAG: sulfatase [Armatimonadota bacterium]
MAKQQRVPLTRRALLAGAAGTALSVGAGMTAKKADATAGVQTPTKRRSIIYILSDDHRYDAMGFMKHPFLETPHLDSLAKNGVHAKNAFVTTALCSPSRASVLTGQYAHRHQVVDNNSPVPSHLRFFPATLQTAGYETAFIGKWHMGGEGDDPQPGFDHWISFKGQGTYLPTPNGLNVDGKRVPQKGYITDELTDYALDWLNTRKGDKPFFLYLSHKAVHSEFIPAERHKGRYAGKAFTPPASQAADMDPEGRPLWVKNQRNSWHGVDYPYHSDLDIAEYHRRYCETLLAVDESVGRIIDFLRRKNLLNDTLLVYMGDNGFAFGEHGLIDKRTAYEESIRVPLLLQCPALLKPGTVMDEVVAGIDIAPTFLEAAGLPPPAPSAMDGTSFLPLARGEKKPWRDSLLYEYYWERTFPHTPTLHALRGDRYKYIRCQGIWDTDELYDLKNDPGETRNLVRNPAHQETVKTMNARLWQILKQTDGAQIPLLPDRLLWQNNKRRPGGPPAATFPGYVTQPPPEKK